MFEHLARTILLGHDRLPPFPLFQAFHDLCWNLADGNNAVADAITEGLRELLTFLPDAYWQTKDEFIAASESAY
ncbi:MAG TPA: hypothetical protein VKB89_19575 [Xanthobacteraceae bacterium]|nr:hypothetical protein [Xanthobacteraceae bacterium]